MASWWQAILDWCNTYGNLASCVGLLITVVGFGLTFWRIIVVGRIARAAQKEIEARTEQIRRETRQAIRKIGGQVIAKIIADALRLLKELRDASHRGEWLRAAEKCQEARSQLHDLVSHPYLLPVERD
jgi:hypothetical protein